MMKKNRDIVTMLRHILAGCTPAVFFVLCLIFCSAASARADGEIILFPGDRYPIPCLSQVRNDREIEVSVENPDIVGLDETGRCIVAVAVGTTEVTVRLTEPNEAYTYVFAVAEYCGMYQGGENVTEEYRIEDTRDAYDMWEEGAYTDGTQGTGTADAEESFNGERQNNDVSESVSTYTDDSPVSHEEVSESIYANGIRDSSAELTESAHNEVSNSSSGEETKNGSSDESEEIFPEEMTEGNALQNDDVTAVSTAPISFTHGIGKYDILVPDHYTLWICGRSAGPISVLYVGTGGIPVRYRTKGNMIYIRSDDLPLGRSCIQVLAADRKGRIGVMKGYEIVRADAF